MFVNQTSNYTYMTIKVFGNIDRKEQKDRQKGTER